MAANGTASRTLKPGIYAPIPTFFHPDTEDLDLSSFKAQVVRVAKAGVGPLLTGSLGEAHHLTHPERTTLIRAARQALDQEGLHHVPIIAGTGVGSTRETIDITLQAAEAGADAAIVIASGYFAGVLAGNKKALKGFWGEVSEKSPIPILMYNFPGSSGGIDLDSELITELATEYPNLVGIKLTCGSVGKLTRICATVTDTAFVAEHPRKGTSEPFLVLGGYADFLVPSTYANGHGAITGLANVAPYTLAKLFQLAETSIKEPALLAEAQQLQGIVARADYVIAKASIAGTKALLERLYGYGGHPRRPLPPIEPSAAQALWDHPDTQALVKIERELSGKA
ncbi:dihydrodipicolinate synthetase [Panus rudis PR-1116 ss-1]|nr:dihydrodipicolinate synthetase [Panus rudis PR-1116 ss-1]